MRLILFAFLLTIFAFENGFGQHTPDSVNRSSIWDSVFKEGYDHHTFPAYPTTVTVNMYLRRITPTDDGFLFEMTFRQTWIDSRLIFADDGPYFVVLPPRADSKRQIWTPDTFFQNGYDYKLYSDPAPNDLIRIYKDGWVLWSQRISIKVSCPDAESIYYTKFCNLDFASYAHTTNNIIYDWKNDTAVQLKEGVGGMMPFFELRAITTSFCTSMTNTGTYSCLRVNWTFSTPTPSRLYAKLYWIPLLLVILSWLPFLINIQSVTVRLAVGFVCLSTLILHWSIVGSELPKFGVATATDVWFTRCLGFIAATFVHLILVVWIKRIKERKSAKASDKENEIEKGKGARTHNEESSTGISFLVDMISLAIFVFTFCVFFLLYSYFAY